MQIIAGLIIWRYKRWRRRKNRAPWCLSAREAISNFFQHGFDFCESLIRACEKNLSFSLIYLVRLSSWRRFLIDGACPLRSLLSPFKAEMSCCEGRIGFYRSGMSIAELHESAHLVERGHRCGPGFLLTFLKHPRVPVKISELVEST